MKGLEPLLPKETIFEIVAFADYATLPNELLLPGIESKPKGGKALTFSNNNSSLIYLLEAHLDIMISISDR